MFVSSHFSNCLRVQYKTYNRGDGISQIIWDGLDFNCLSHTLGNKLLNFRFRRATISGVEICLMVLIPLKQIEELNPIKLLLGSSN